MLRQKNPAFYRLLQDKLEFEELGVNMSEGRKKKWEKSWKLHQNATRCF